MRCYFLLKKRRNIPEINHINLIFRNLQLVPHVCRNIPFLVKRKFMVCKYCNIRVRIARCAALDARAKENN